MIEYPKDKLYLRVGNLLTKLKEIASENSNLELYAYLRTISNGIKPDDIEWVVKTEQHISSPNFLNQKAFKEIDRDKMKPIIRDYKLNQLL
jgi:hypothetical protein